MEAMTLHSWQKFTDILEECTAFSYKEGDVGSIFLQSTGKLLPNNTASHLRRQYTCYVSTDNGRNN